MPVSVSQLLGAEYKEADMARPSFQTTMGEPAAALHLYLKQSQMDQIEKLANDGKTSKASLVREALDYWLTSFGKTVQ